MAQRTNEADVKGILQGEYDSLNQPSLSPFIDTASGVVDWLMAWDTAHCSELSATTLKAIECWLTAHYYQISDPGYSSRTTASASGAFLGQATMTLKATRFGQQALLLDSTNRLAKRDKEVEEGGRRRVQLYVPTDPCDSSSSGCF